MAPQHMHFSLPAVAPLSPPQRAWAHAGTAASGDAEVLLMARPLDGRLEAEILTTLTDGPALWQRLLADWAATVGAGDLQIVIQDSGAAPVQVLRRLREAWGELNPSADGWDALQTASFWEAGARERARGLVDADSFRELLGPQHRLGSPHLPQMGFSTQWDDGVVTGVGRLGQRLLFVVSMEGRYVGGSLGEVNGAKMWGTLRLALQEYRRGWDGRHLPPGGPAVAVVFETGGVRLQEANAGLLACAELMDAFHDLRDRVPTIALVGGRLGSFGGLGFVTEGTDALIMSEFGRLGLTGPEVVEEEMGKDEFDASDRALVWRTTGGRHRYLTGDANYLVADSIGAFRHQVQAVLALDAAALTALRRIGRRDLVEQELELVRRAAAAEPGDSRDIWRVLGYPDPDGLADLPSAAFRAIQRRWPPASGHEQGKGWQE